MDEQPGLVARAAIRLTAWTERWIPDAFIFALLATFIVFATPEEGIGIPVDLAGFGEAFDALP